MTRHLVAILSLDVVGYTARLATDRAEALASANLLLRDVVRPAVVDNGGRLVKLMGDGALAAFPSAAGAIAAAARIQSETAGAALQLRAGIHAGDVEERNGATTSARPSPSPCACRPRPCRAAR